jgi:hypothetical protein
MAFFQRRAKTDGRDTPDGRVAQPARTKRRTQRGGELCIIHATLMRPPSILIAAGDPQAPGSRAGGDTPAPLAGASRGD